MNSRHAFILAILMLALPLSALGQGQGDQEKVWGDYAVRGSVELGGRVADAQGNQQMYNTLVDLQSGPRFLSQELSMESLSRQGVLFDNLYMSSFGLGGDPEGMVRLRMNKAKWYDFVALYRRDKNYFDYDLFVNPLQANGGANYYVPFINGTTYNGNAVLNGNYSPQAVPWFTDSPHLQAMTRNMGDFSLTLLPESKVTFRLGYARNASYGLLDTTVSASAGQGEDSQWRSDRYQIGADLKMLPRTTLSFDFFWEHDKTDFNFLDNNQLFTLQGTTLPVDIGLTFFPYYSSSASGTNSTSCTTQPIIPSTGVFILSLNCTGALLQYFKQGNVRTNIPTGQFSLVSNYFHKLDVTASGSYSSANSDFLNYNEFSYGLSPSLLNGPSTNGRVTANADLGLTYHFTDSLFASNKFRWVDWHQSGLFTSTQLNCSHASGSTLLSAFLNPCGQATALFGYISGVNPGASLAGNAASGNFLSSNAYGTLIGERSFFNTTKLTWQPSRRTSLYAGYRFTRRELKDGTGDGLTPTVYVQNQTVITNVCQLSGNPQACTTFTPSTGAGVDVERINQHTGLLGVVLRPVDNWRINSDLELTYADNYFTVLSPRHQQRFRLYTTYKMKQWGSVHAGAHFVESRNDFGAGELIEGTTTPLFPATFFPTPYGNKNHWRYYTLGTTLTPYDKLTIDFGWTLQDQSIVSATCMPLPTIAFGVANPLGTPTPLNCNNTPTGTITWSTSYPRALNLNYEETTNSGYVNISYRPVKRVTLELGYDLTADNGRTTWLRGDSGQPLLVVGDSYGNVPYITPNLLGCPAGISTIAVTGGNACLWPGPFPDQPLGPQAMNWHKAYLGVGVEVVKGVEFKGLWSYYDYNSKDEVPSLSLLRVTLPRDFHANVGTLSLKYSF